MGYKKMDINYIKEVMAKENYTLLSEEYKNNKTKLKIKCDKGHEYEATWAHYNQGSRCPHCNIESKKFTYKEVKEYIEKDGYVLLSKEYKNSNQKLKIQCDKGHIYEVSYLHYKYSGSRCPHCNKELKIQTLKKSSEERKNDYEYIKSEMEKDGNILLSKEYISNKKPLSIQCPNGHVYNASWGSFLQGSRCPHCVSSKGEKEIENILNKFNIEYISQYRFKDCKDKIELPFDFYIPNLNVAIEYDGEQHYKPVDFANKGAEWATNNMLETQRRDNIKTQYCLDNNIKLIRIPYWEFNNIENILKDSLF